MIYQNLFNKQIYVKIIYMETITILLNDKQILKLKQTFADNIVSKCPNYALFQIKVEGCTITVYTSKKAVFQGKDANIYAMPFTKDTQFIDQCGSDEVGTGDYFGPVVVCATKVTKENVAFLKKLKVQDSKALTDNDIMDIASKIIPVIPHTILILDNAKYNKVHQTNNLNMIKAKLHNQAYINLSKKTDLTELKIIDQFCNEESYYNYLKNETNIIRNIHFETKAENKYLSVACASIIARYAFLDYFDKLSKHYDFNFHKGASSLVDKDIIAFVDRYGKQELYNVAKVNFKNTLVIK